MQLAGRDVEGDVVGDDEAAETLAQAVEAQDRLSHGGRPPNSRAELRAKPDQAAAREQHDQHQQRPEDELPVFGQARQPFLDQDEGERADDRAVQPADAAEQHHDDQFARALPRHVGGTDEIGRVGEQKARRARRARRTST